MEWDRIFIHLREWKNQIQKPVESPGKKLIFPALLAERSPCFNARKHREGSYMFTGGEEGSRGSKNLHSPDKKDFFYILRNRENNGTLLTLHPLFWGSRRVPEGED